MLTIQWNFEGNYTELYRLPEAVPDSSRQPGRVWLNRANAFRGGRRSHRLAKHRVHEPLHDTRGHSPDFVLVVAVEIHIKPSAFSFTPFYAEAGGLAKHTQGDSQNLRDLRRVDPKGKRIGNDPRHGGDHKSADGGRQVVQHPQHP